MTIRRSQLASIDAAVQKGFVADVEEHVREVFPQQCAAAGPRETRRLVESGLSTGKACGFQLGAHLIQCVHLVFLYGESFARRPHVAPVLRRQGLSPEERLRRTFASLEEGPPRSLTTREVRP